VKVYFRELKLSTTEKLQLVDITRQVEEIVKESGVVNGVCLIFAPHATAAIIMNERESGLIQDILTKVKELTEPERSWKHNLIDDNAHAHIGSVLLGSDKALPIRNGKLVRGVWQNIFLLELDGPRTERTVVVEVLGE